MAKTVFDKILDSTTGPKSYNYFKNQVNKITSPGARALINQGKATIRPKFGVMNLFGYDPKNKLTLPSLSTFIVVGFGIGCFFPYLPSKANLGS